MVDKQYKAPKGYSATKIFGEEKLQTWIAKQPLFENFTQTADPTVFNMRTDQFWSNYIAKDARYSIIAKISEPREVKLQGTVEWEKSKVPEIDGYEVLSAKRVFKTTQHSNMI